jgi:UDP-N-acetyl-D-galactosamine dehydrogenase
VGILPERIYPGYKVHSSDNIVKVVAVTDDFLLDIMTKGYGLIVDAGVHRTESIKVIEAAKGF